MNKLIQKTLKNGKTVKAYCGGENILGAKFQAWATTYGVTHEESLAMLAAGDDNLKELYFGCKYKSHAAAYRGFNKVNGVEIPDLTDFEAKMMNKSVASY